MKEEDADRWYQWLLERRFGGDERRARLALGAIGKWRDQVLEHAELRPNEVLLDVGCGDGMVAFGALQREPSCQVVFSDVSEELLAHCRRLAEEGDHAGRCRFVRAAARDLAGVDDASVDVVTTRSVLIYEDEKRRAFEEFWRVLRPGGRISLFEPIIRWFADSDGRIPSTFDLTAVADLARRVGVQFGRSSSKAMADFSERDFLQMAEAAGFRKLNLRLDVSVTGTFQRRWDSFFRSSPNPLAPTWEEAVREALTPEEAERFVAHLRPLVERGEGTERHAFAFLWARKPTP